MLRDMLLNISFSGIIFDEAKDAILQRASSITQDNTVVYHIQGMLDKLRDEWEMRARQGQASGLAYMRTATATELLKSSDTPAEPFACPNSLRDVEKSVDLILETDATGLSYRGV